MTLTLNNILHINIRVPAAEVDACRDFYCTILGLKVGPRPPFESAGFWLYAGESPVVHLVSVAPDPARRLPERGHPSLDHVAFQCTGVGAVLDTLKANNIVYRISTVPTLDVLQVSFTDPVGVGIELSFDGESLPSARPGTSGK